MNWVWYCKTTQGFVSYNLPNCSYNTCLPQDSSIFCVACDVQSISSIPCQIIHCHFFIYCKLSIGSSLLYVSSHVATPYSLIQDINSLIKKRTKFFLPKNECISGIQAMEGTFQINMAYHCYGSCRMDYLLRCVFHLYSSWDRWDIIYYMVYIYIAREDNF